MFMNFIVSVTAHFNMYSSKNQQIATMHIFWEHITREGMASLQKLFLETILATQS